MPTEAELLAAAAKEAGLVRGESRVREGDVTGVYLEPLNIIDGRLWIAVRADEPVVMNGRTYGHRRHFYQDWEMVS